MITPAPSNQPRDTQEPEPALPRHWQPRFGAVPVGDGLTSFRVLAAGRQNVEVVCRDEQGERSYPLSPEGNGSFSAIVPAAAGTLYGYKVDGKGPFADPASRSQPDGVSGLSLVVDGSAFQWRHEHAADLSAAAPVIMELNIATFSPEGTFKGAIAGLRHLAEMGVDAIQVMPVWECPGEYNWGYDQTFPFAPHHKLGTPDELRELIDAAHGVGISVVLDVVYNHLGQDAAHFEQVSPGFFSSRFTTWWGQAFDYDKPEVRAYFVDHALYCLNELGADALRLDATHAMHDDSETRGGRHIIAEIAAEARARSDKPVMISAEDPREDPRILAPAEQGGYGIDKQYYDEFHHRFRAYACGLSHGYFAPFKDTTIADIVAEVKKIAETPGRREIFLANHDQVGNVAPFLPPQATVDPAEMRAWTVLAAVLPATLMLFQGQTWFSSAPFYYFRDGVSTELGQAIREGRKREFKEFFEEADEIPDPMQRATFESSKVRWDELNEPAHAAAAGFHADLLALRASEPGLRPEAPLEASKLDGECLLIERAAADGSKLLVAVCLRGSAELNLSAHAGSIAFTEVFNSGDERYGAVKRPSLDGQMLRFEEAGAVVLRCVREK